MTRHNLPRWPLFLIAAPAAVAVWSGWVGLGALSGFGIVHPLPGIAPSFELNTAITLPVGVEAYGAYALGVWLAPGGVPGRARLFARWSAIGALVLGISGQVIYHLLASRHAAMAPAAVIVLVSCLPVITLGFGTALTHLLRSSAEDAVGIAAPAPWPAVAEVHRVPAGNDDTVAAVCPAAPGLLPTAQETAAAAGGRPGTGSPNTAGAGAADQCTGTGTGSTSAPASAVRPPRAPRPHPASEEDVDSQEKALGIVAADRNISGAELGRRVGVKERQGRYLKEASLATLAEMESGSTEGAAPAPGSTASDPQQGENGAA